MKFVIQIPAKFVLQCVIVSIFHGSLTTLTVSRASTYVAAYLTSGKIRSVHVRVGQTVAHAFQSRIEITWGDALGRRSGDVCCRDRPRDGS